MSDDTQKVPKHPGAFLKELLQEHSMQQADLALILGQLPQGITLIVSERRGISPEMSKALGRVFGLPPDHFANLQTQYDIHRADDPPASVATRAEIVSTYPIRDMIKRGWISDCDGEGLEREIAEFFETSLADSAPSLHHAAKRTGGEHLPVNTTLLAWLFRARKIARAMVCPKYSPQSLKKAMVRLQSLTAAPEETRNVPRILSECGVRFLVVETLPTAKIDGACFWLDSESPVVAMSMRHDRIDNFWFVLRHELEHVLRRHADVVDAELEGANAGTSNDIPEQERIANAAASDFCVRESKMDSFIARKRPFFYERDVLAFATINRVHPGIVVGQMQHKLNRYDYLRKHQVKVRQCVLPSAIVDGWGNAVPIGGDHE